MASVCLFVAAMGEKPNAGNPHRQSEDQSRRTLRSKLHFLCWHTFKSNNPVGGDPNHPLPKSRRARPKKIQKKTEKKACQPLASSARPELRATNSPVWPFKKTSKKVKKKLVSALEIE